MANGEQHEVIIVGGGIAGMAAAWDLRDRDVVVLEAEDRVGGRMRSESRDPYWLNMGAHLFGGPETVLGSLVKEAGLETIPIPGNIMGLAANGKILTSGRIETYPLRLPLSIKARLSFIRAGLKVRGGVKKFLKIERGAGESLESFRTRRLAFDGDRTFADYLGKLHPDTHEIFEATTARITARMDEVASGGGLSLFAYVWSVGPQGLLLNNLKGGSGLLPRALAQQLGERVVTGAHAGSVVQTANGVSVKYTLAGREREASGKYAIVATPAPITRKMLTDLPPETATALDGITYGPFVVAAFLTNETGPMPYDGTYAIAVAGKSFNMFFNHANPVHGGGRGAGGSLMVYAGADRGRRLMDKSDDEVRDIFLADIYSLFPQTKGTIAETIVQRWPLAIPYTAVGRYRLQPGLERPLGNVFLAGDYLEFPAMESAALSGREAAKKVRERLEE